MKCVVGGIEYEPSEERVKEFPESLNPKTCEYDHWAEDALCYCPKCDPICPLCKNERISCTCV